VTEQNRFLQRKREKHFDDSVDVGIDRPDRGFPKTGLATRRLYR
jgi:hypothetical protein